MIKIATSGGVLSPTDSPDQRGFAPDEIEVMVAEATAAGLFVMSHAQAAVGIKNAVRAGVRSIEHGIYIDDEALELMLEHGTYLVPTLVAPLGVLRAADAGVPIPEHVLTKATDVSRPPRLDPARRRGRCEDRDGHRRGVVPHGTNLEELELMADLGMRPTDVLVATTKTAAELMGLDGGLGTLEPGKRADLVVVAGDALDFTDLPSRIERVYKDGELVVEAAAEPAPVPV